MAKTFPKRFPIQGCACPAGCAYFTVGQVLKHYIIQVFPVFVNECPPVFFVVYDRHCYYLQTKPIADRESDTGPPESKCAHERIESLTYDDLLRQDPATEVIGNPGWLAILERAYDAHCVRHPDLLDRDLLSCISRPHLNRAAVIFLPLNNVHFLVRIFAAPP
jgi:hypothetical protein